MTTSPTLTSYSSSFTSSASSSSSNFNGVEENENYRLSSSTATSRLSSNKKAPVSTIRSPPTGSNLMEHFSSMSKQYLQIITAWCFCLLVMNCLYIAFSFFDFGDATSVSELSDQKKSSCISIGVLLHYFLLCSFCFSMCITLIQFFIVYRSFTIFRFLFLKSSLFSFGK